MMLDLGLAILHHLIVFALFAILFAELIIVRPSMDGAWVQRISRIDAWYGILAAAIIVVGFTRANLAAKGWAYYQSNAYFWAKIATFLLIGLLSIGPTLAFRRWRNEGAGPSEESIARVRRYLVLEVVLFVPLIAFAAAMARGYGMS